MLAFVFCIGFGKTHKWIFHTTNICIPVLKIQEDAALCGNNPVVSALTMELSKETLDTMLEGLGRIRDQLSAVANKWMLKGFQQQGREVFSAYSWLKLQPSVTYCVFQQNKTKEVSFLN